MLDCSDQLLGNQASSTVRSEHDKNNRLAAFHMIRPNRNLQKRKKNKNVKVVQCL